MIYALFRERNAVLTINTHSMTARNFDGLAGFELDDPNPDYRPIRKEEMIFSNSKSNKKLLRSGKVLLAEVLFMTVVVAIIYLLPVLQ